MSVGSVITGILQFIGLLDAVKQAIHDKSVATAAVTVDRSNAQAGIALQVEQKQRIISNVQSMSHDQLVADYVQLQSRIAVASSAQ